MLNEEILTKLRKGSVIIVRVSNDYIINGVIERISYVEYLGEESFYTIQLNFNGQTVDLDSRDNLEFIYWTEQHNEEYIEHLIKEDEFDEVLEQYQIGKENYLVGIINKWDIWNDEEKKKICEGLPFRVKSKDFKDIFDFIQEKNDCINKLCQKANKSNEDLISNLEKDIEFLDRYEKFKKLLPEEVGKLYDFLLYKVWGYQ